MKRILTLVLAATFAPGLSAEEDFDFVMIGNDCKTLVSYNVISDESLRVLDADTPVFFCKRNSKQIACDVTHMQEAEKTVQRTYRVDMDAPPILLFQAENGSEAAYIDTVEMVGSYSSRTFGEKFMGYKVCNTLFLTYDQYKMLQENKKEGH